MHGTWRRSWLAVAALLAAGPLACGPAGDEVVDDLETDDMDLFASTGKMDTGYVSDQAAELEAVLTGKVYVDVTKLSSSERDRLLAAARLNNATGYDAFKMHPGEQVKYGRNTLKNAKFNANMESAPATVSKTEVVAGNAGVWVTYTLKVESLVKNKDLPRGTTIADLVGTTLSLKLPADPVNAFAAGGVKCATDPDDPRATDAALAAELTRENYFYYWNADRRGCPLATKGVTTVTYKVTNPAAAKNTYPEFDKLLADKKVTLVMIFGQLEHGELLDEDWGWVGYDEMKDWLRGQRFTKNSEERDLSKSRWTRKYNANFTVEVDLISPLKLQDHADAAVKDAIIVDAIKNHEIVYYNGHSFYGSLRVLDTPANFPKTYQIVFMDSCWSYAYYTKQVFTAKAALNGSADPTGMLMADVINNTEPGISGSHETFGVFLKKLFYAANMVSNRQKPASYTWKNLITYMNTDARRRADEARRAGEEQDPEIYGASGVATNKYKP